jgi:hypothetical protein
MRPRIAGFRSWTLVTRALIPTDAVVSDGRQQRITGKNGSRPLADVGSLPAVVHHREPVEAGVLDAARELDGRSEGASSGSWSNEAC